MNTIEFLDYAQDKSNQLRKLGNEDTAATMQRLINISRSYQAQLKNKDRKLEEFSCRYTDLYKEYAEFRALSPNGDSTPMSSNGDTKNTLGVI